MPKPVLIAASLVAACLSAGSAHADALQDQLVATAKGTNASAYGFRRTMTIQQTGKPRKILVEQYDPQRPAADQWSLIGVDGRAPTAKESADAHKVKRGPAPSYGELAKWSARLPPGPARGPAMCCTTSRASPPAR